MKVSQIYEMLNKITNEVLGDSVIVNEDLSNIVEVGRAFEDANSLDNYVRALNDHIGKMWFVDRVYRGRAPSVFMDSWEFGSIVEKVSAELPEATENESWELQDGASYDPNIFYKPKVTVALWNDRITFEIPISITEKQVKSAFSSATQMNSFMSMIRNAVDNSMTLKLENLIRRTINNFIGLTIKQAYSGSDFTGVGNTRAINILALYNAANPDATLTAANFKNNPEFIRFASELILNYKERMTSMSTLFNIGGKVRFTPEDRMKIVMLSEFRHASDIYLQSDVYHNELTKLPEADITPYWQAPGTEYAFGDVSKIDVKTSNGDIVSASGILAVMFDRDALGVTCMDSRVTSQYNAKAEFWNEWHKYDAGYFNDINENFVVFFAA